MGGLQQALTRVSEVRQGCISGLNFLHLDCLNLARDEMNHFLCYAEALWDLLYKVPSIGVKRLSSKNRIF